MGIRQYKRQRDTERVRAIFNNRNNIKNKCFLSLSRHTDFARSSDRLKKTVLCNRESLAYAKYKETALFCAQKVLSVILSITKNLWRLLLKFKQCIKLRLL